MESDMYFCDSNAGEKNDQLAYKAQEHYCIFLSRKTYGTLDDKDQCAYIAGLILYYSKSTIKI